MDILKGFDEHFRWFILTLAALAIIWFMNGGPARQTAHEGQYLKPPAPLDSGKVYGTYYAGSTSTKKETLDLPQGPATLVKNTATGIENFLALSKQAEAIHANSLLARKISLDGVAGARASDPKDEYIRILASEFATSSISVSGLLIQGTLPSSAALVPKAVGLVTTSLDVQKDDVILPPGGRALITTGASPIGTSFRVNICTGYFDQSKAFVPGLRNDCPDPQSVYKALGPSDDSSCLSFIQKIPRCRAYEGAFPSGLSNTCKTFVAEKLTYQGCVADHKSDKDFYLNEWRLYLDQTNELWKDQSEIIKLLDARGGIIDAITY